MVLAFRSNVARSQTTGQINGSYDSPRGVNDSYSSFSNISVLQGIEEQLQETQKKVIEITTRGESPLMQKMYQLMYKLGISIPERRAHQKIQDLEKTLTRYDLTISRHQVNAGSYLKETKELTTQKNVVGRDCLQLEEMSERLTEEYAKIEADQTTSQEHLQSGTLSKPEARQVLQDLQALEEEKKNLDYDLSQAEHQLNNAIEVHDTLETRMQIRDDQYTTSDFSLRKLHDQRRELFRTVEYLKVYAESNPLTSVVAVIKLMQEGESKTRVGDEILQVYQGLHQEVATSMDQIPNSRRRARSSRDDLYGKLKGKNRTDRAERLKEIKEQLYGGGLTASPEPSYSPGKKGNGTSPVVVVATPIDTLT